MRRCACKTTSRRGTCLPRSKPAVSRPADPDFKIKVKENELRILDDQSDRFSQAVEQGPELDQQITEYKSELENLQKEIELLRRDQTNSLRALNRKKALKGGEEQFIMLFEKMNQELGQLKLKVAEENKRLENIEKTTSELREKVIKENVETLNLRQKHEVDVDFDELTDKNIEEAEKKYWALVSKRNDIEDHIKVIENNAQR